MLHHFTQAAPLQPFNRLNRRRVGIFQYRNLFSISINQRPIRPKFVEAYGMPLQQL